MLLTSSFEAQAVPGLLFFSPSAATLCRGTPDPTLWRSGSAHRPARAPAGPGPGPGPGPAGGRAGLHPIHGRLGVRAGPGPGPGPGRAQGPARTSGFRRQAGGGRLRGFPTSGRRAPPTLFSPARVIQLPCLLCFGVSVALTILRGSLGAGRGGHAASTPSRGSLGALWRQAALAAPGSCPFLCSEQRAGPGRARAVGFIAGRSRWA